MTLKNILITIRPKQWIKNTVVFAALIFSQNLFKLEYLKKSLWAFFIFCGISSSIYILNDIIDIKEDQKHPLKSKRPIASGQLKINFAILVSLILALLSLILAFYLNYYLGLIIFAYFILQVTYSRYLKHIVIIEALVIALGFVLRALAGAVVIKVVFSYWLLICTLLLALFLGFGKRRHELVLLNNTAGEHRQILREYSPYLLDQMIGVVTASTLIIYILYTTSSDVIERFGTTNLVYTSPFVLYGIFRYLYLIHKKEKGGSPTQTLLTDKPLLLDIFLWIISIIIIIYYF